MDRVIWTAWRAFWVGLGASAVLIAQSLLEPPQAASVPPSPAIEEPPSLETAPVQAKSADPTLSRNPFDSTRGKVNARVRNAS